MFIINFLREEKRLALLFRVNWGILSVDSFSCKLIGWRISRDFPATQAGQSMIGGRRLEKWESRRRRRRRKERIF